jgi:hypothetical protein
VHDVEGGFAFTMEKFYHWLRWIRPYWVGELARVRGSTDNIPQWPPADDPSIPDCCLFKKRSTFEALNDENFP